MNIEQIYTGCLAQGAYYITSEGETAIIDPLREVQPYLNRVLKTLHTPGHTLASTCYLLLDENSNY